MGKNIEHYSIDKIKSLNADINLIYGERSNGKSYQVKHVIALDTFINSYNKLSKESLLTESVNELKRFFLLRRFEVEIKSNFVQKYFADVDIKRITNGEYTTIDVYRKEIFLANIDEKTRKIRRGVKIGYVGSLSTEQNYAMQSYLDVYNIIFEEFMVRNSPYLHNEPDKLMNFYSTIDRKRNIVKLWLVGNTISRVCPYLNDWGLMDLVKKQKQGDISLLKVPTGDFMEDGTSIDKTIAVEYCKSSGRSSYVIGKHANMLNKGEWQSDPQPNLKKSYNEYKKLFMIGFQYQSFKFLGELLKDKETKEVVWFIKPYDDEWKDNILIFSDIVNQKKNYQRNIYDVTINSSKLQNVLNSFRESNIFYANDLVGTDFKQAIDFSIRR